MELHAESRVPAMGERHDLAVSAPGGDLKRAVLVEFDDQRVIATGLEGTRQAGEKAATLVLDGGGAAMHRRPGVHCLSAEGFADALMAQAYAEDRQFAGEEADKFERGAGIL